MSATGSRSTATSTGTSTGTSTTGGPGVTIIRNGRAELALHHLREGHGRPLLLLHGLAERTPTTPPAYASTWSGPIHGLDFVGHGASTVPPGGGYTAEVLMADADVALATLGACTVLGRGLGAYIALLIAGARPELVRGAILADGPGLIGGGIRPPSPMVVPPDPALDHPPDPLALVEMSRDVRPPDYAAEFVRMALHGSGLDQPIAVSAVVRPEWLTGVVGEFGVVELPVASALARFAAVA